MCFRDASDIHDFMNLPSDLLPESPPLSLQGAVTKCDVDAVPMFVFFRKRKVLYQVGMYMFQNEDLHVAVTCTMITCFNHIAVCVSSAVFLNSLQGLGLYRLTYTL